MANCSCRQETEFEYVKALNGTGAWPFDPVWPKASVEEILSRLDRFSYQPPSSACRKCRQNYESIVKDAVEMTRIHFDGLCLDCMERSMPRDKDQDEEYLNDNAPTPDDWSRRCRIRHGEPTWYFSYMGRKEYRDVLFKTLYGRYPSRMR